VDVDMIICNICSCIHKHVDITDILKSASAQLLFVVCLLYNEPFGLILVF
jgi:hypothetical protein